MGQKEYWKKLCEKNPAFKKDSVRIKTDSLQKIVFQAYEMGCKNSANAGNIFSDMFGGGFGK